MTRRSTIHDFGREDASVLPANYLTHCFVEKDIVGMLETLLDGNVKFRNLTDGTVTHVWGIVTSRGQAASCS